MRSTKRPSRCTRWPRQELPGTGPSSLPARRRDRSEREPPKPGPGSSFLICQDATSSMFLGSPKDAGGSVVEVFFFFEMGSKAPGSASVDAHNHMRSRGECACCQSSPGWLRACRQHLLHGRKDRVRPIHATPGRTQPTLGSWLVTLHGAR
jgi:hypothetical protein